MTNSADPDQLELSWIYTVRKSRVYLGSAGLGLIIFDGNFSSHSVIVTVKVGQKCIGNAEYLSLSISNKAVTSVGDDSSMNLFVLIFGHQHGYCQSVFRSILETFLVFI